MTIIYITVKRNTSLKVHTLSFYLSVAYVFRSFETIFSAHYDVYYKSSLLRSTIHASKEIYNSPQYVEMLINNIPIRLKYFGPF